MDERALEAYLGFSQDDLEANRAGRLSSSQAWRLGWSGVWRLIVGPVLLVVAAVIAVVVGTAFIALIALACAAYGLYLAWRGFAFLVDGYDGAVAFVTGSMRRWTVRGRYGVSYFAGVGPVSKRITRAAYDSLRSGLNCHLYYSPGCRSLLSVESASAEQPKPDHPFGPDSAHTWDRLRWSWVLIAIGGLGVLVAAHTIATAHPARPISVEGTIANYVETHGKSTTRTIYLDNGNTYTPEREDYYTPAAPSFGSLIGAQVVLYIDAGTADVIAIEEGDVLHASDWYVHPEHETEFDVNNGAVIAIAALIALAIGGGLIFFGRRSGAVLAATDSSAPPPYYAPPTVRGAIGLWPSVVLVALVCATFLFAAVVAVHN